MKGKQLTLEEVLRLDDGSKVWVEDDRENFDNEIYIYNKKNKHLNSTKYFYMHYDLNIIEVYHNKLTFYKWIDDETFDKMWSNTQKFMKETEHDVYIPLPFDESPIFLMATEICNLRGINLTEDNIDKIMKEFVDKE